MITEKTNHISVLLGKVIETLGDVNGKTVIDATFGAGGYSRALLENGANVIAFDRDPSVKKFADKLGSDFGNKFEFINSEFSTMTDLEKQFDAIVFDFGVSSMQIDTPERGFSWRFDAPLDMRMCNSKNITAADLIQNSSEQELVKIFRDYGDLKKANIIARVLKQKLPKTTYELRNLIFNPNDVAPVFQSLRITVNDEMGEIDRALNNAVPNLLKPGGICICVTFHSLEDRLVKTIFRKWTTAPGDPRLPSNNPAPFKLLKTFRPDDSELTANSRSRSAHLRAVQKEI